MAIKTYTKNGKQFYEVYLNESVGKGTRRQVRRRGFTSMRQAEAQEFELKVRLSDQKRNPFCTWDEWLKTCIEKMRFEFKPSTVINYEGQLAKWTSRPWGNKRLQEITARDVHELIFSTEGQFSQATRKTILKMIKRIFQMAMEEGILTQSPALKVRVKVPERKQAVFNANEVDIFLRHAKRVGHQFYEVWAVALLTGMRSGELYALRWSDVDLDNRRIMVSQSWSSKNGFGPTKSAKTRVVPICDDLEWLLKELKLKSLSNEGFVLPHVTEWTQARQAGVIRDFCKILEITSIKFHDLRATFITQMLLKGVSLAQVMAIELKTTNLYLRLAGADLIGATDKLGFQLPRDEIAQLLQIAPRGVSK